MAPSTNETKPLNKSHEATTKSSPNYVAIATGAALVALVALAAVASSGGAGLRGSGVAGTLISLPNCGDQVNHMALGLCSPDTVEMRQKCQFSCWQDGCSRAKKPDYDWCAGVYDWKVENKSKEVFWKDFGSDITQDCRSKFPDCIKICSKLYEEIDHNLDFKHCGP